MTLNFLKSTQSSSSWFEENRLNFGGNSNFCTVEESSLMELIFGLIITCLISYVFFSNMKKKEKKETISEEVRYHVDIPLYNLDFEIKLIFICL